jgi:hypothetical protein
VPAFQSLPSRLKASIFQLASNVTHEDARTKAGDTKRVTKVRIKEVNMIMKVMVGVDGGGSGGSGGDLTR